MNTEHLYLFTKVEDGLPEKRLNVLAININNGWQSECFWSGMYWFNEWDDDKTPCNPTHWLDLSKLTTKERAVEFASDAYNTGHKEGTMFISKQYIFDKNNRDNYIQQNKNKL